MSRTTNADVLNKLNITMLDDDFNCAITYEVMDDPVIDPRTLNPAALLWLNSSHQKKTTSDCGNFKEVPRYDRSTLVKLINSNDSTGINCTSIALSRRSYRYFCQAK